MQTLTFEQLPNAVADLSRKVDYLTALLTTNHNNAATVPTEEADIVTIKQASEILNLAIPTIYAMVGRNEIPFMKLTKKLYFSRRELECLIREGRKKTTAECAQEVRNTLSHRKGGHMATTEP